MPVGIQTYTSAGLLQFDNDSIQYGMETKGNVNYTVPANGVFNWSITRNKASNTLVAIYSASHPVYVTNYTSGSDTVSTVYIREAAGTTGTFTYYIFRNVNQFTPAGNVGFQCYNSSGTVTFDTRALPLRIVNVYNQIDIAGGTVTGTAIPSGKKYAAIIGQPGHAVIAIDYNRYTRIGSFVRTPATGNVLYVYKALFTDMPRPTPANKASILTVDVTNY